VVVVADLVEEVEVLVDIEPVQTSPSHQELIQSVLVVAEQEVPPTSPTPLLELHHLFLVLVSLLSLLLVVEEEANGQLMVFLVVLEVVVDLTLLQLVEQEILHQYHHHKETMVELVHLHLETLAEVEVLVELELMVDLLQDQVLVEMVHHHPSRELQ